MDTNTFSIILIWTNKFDEDGVIPLGQDTTKL